MSIGFLMIRGVAEIRGPEGASGASSVDQPGRRLLERTCAARNVADFAIELIRRRWPVSPAAHEWNEVW
jgi:hypothetical protein